MELVVGQVMAERTTSVSGVASTGRHGNSNSQQRSNVANFSADDQENAGPGLYQDVRLAV